MPGFIRLSKIEFRRTFKMKFILALCFVICLAVVNSSKLESRALKKLLQALKDEKDEQNMSLMSEMVEGRKKVMKRSTGCSCDTETSSSGGSDSSSGLSSGQKQAILDEHNRLRAEVGVSVQLTWNAELASIAQTYAEKCVFQHNSNRNNEQESWWWIGENIATGYPWSDADTAISKGMNGWGEKEKKYFEYGTGCVGGVCGHYTQMIWKTTTEVGCGVAHCDQISNIGWSNAYLMVCNYGPTGNVGGYSTPY